MHESTHIVNFIEHDILEDKDITDYRNWLQFPHVRVSGRKTNMLWKISIAGKFYYLKLYSCPSYKDAFRIFLRGGIIGQSRCKKEYNNLLYLNSKGIAPKPLVFCEKKRYGILLYSFLVIENIEDAIPLDYYIFGKISTLTIEQRIEFIKSLAITTKKMNENSFVNGEYHWRNILVVVNKDRFLFQIIDCSSTKLRHTYFYPYLDLATLDIYSEKFFSIEERTLFFKTYFDIDQVTLHQKKIIKNIIKLKEKVSKKELRRYHKRLEKYKLEKYNEIY